MMSALVAQPVWPAPARPARRRGDARPVGRGTLQLVGPGFVPPAVQPAVEPGVPARVVSRPAQAGAAGLRLTARGRRLLTVLALVAATGASVALGALVGTAANPSSSSATTTTVTVAPGQTLWSLASAAAAPGEDPRDVLEQIADINGLASADLAVGQELLVPVD